MRGRLFRSGNSFGKFQVSAGYPFIRCTTVLLLLLLSLRVSGTLHRSIANHYRCKEAFWQNQSQH